MERIKEEIVSNADKLQAEIHEITLRLNSILQENKKIAGKLKELDYKELLSNKDYYLTVTNQQHTTIQMLLSLNVQLEELQNNNKLTRKNCTMENNAFSLKCEEIEPQRSSKPQNHVFNFFNNNNNNVSESSSLSTTEERSVPSSSDGFEILLNVNKSKKLFEEELNPSVLDKLKQYDLLSRRDRYINSLTKPVMPDFSFRKAATVPGRKVNTQKVKLKKENERKSRRNEDVREDCKDVDGNEILLSEKNFGTVHRCEIKNKKEVVNDTLTLNFIKEDSPSSIFEGTLKEPPEPHLNSKCLISCIKSPSKFYINILDDNIEPIERISADYAKHHDSPEAKYLSKKAARKNLKSTFCLCYIETWESWYRAKIIDWQDKSDLIDEVTVFLVDYGYTMNVMYTNLRPLLKKYSEIPQCAIKCHLAYLFPPDFLDENKMDDWPVDSINKFKDIVGSESQSVFEIVYLEFMNESWAIDLIQSTDNKNNNEEEDGTSIGQLLIDSKSCIEIVLPQISEADVTFIKTQLLTAQGLHGISSDMSDSDKLEIFCKNTEIKDPKSLDDALVNYKARDEARTCHLFRKYGSCYKLPNCKFDHAPLRKDGYTTDKVEAHIEAALPLNLPSVGQTIDVRITSISSLTSWYGHIISNIATYARLVETLNSAKNVHNYKKLDILPTRGEMVIVKSEVVSNEWCRGQVTEVYQTPLSPVETIQIFLVDTGDIIESKLSELRGISQELLVLPFQAVLLKLQGVKEKDNGLIDSITFCEKNYLSKIFKAKVLHASGYTLVVTLTKHDVDIRKEIIEGGYGELTDDSFPCMSSKLLFD